VRSQVRVGHLLRERGGGGDQHRRLLAQQRVQRGDPQAYEVGRRRQVRLVAHPASRVEAHGPGRQERFQVGRQVTRRAVVAGDHQRGALRLGVEQRGQQVGPQAAGYEGALGLGARRGGQRGHAGVVVCVLE
jgi:hypothetical protein